MMQWFHHYFLPHHTNNFRAKILHADFLLLVALFFINLVVVAKGISRFNPDILGFATNIHVDELLESTNQKRTEAHVPKLKLSPELSRAAALKASDMFSKDYWAHVAPDGTTPWNFIHEAGYVYTVAGENLAKNFSGSPGVVEAWMNSPSHRENLLRLQYQDVGFAVVNGKLDGEETTLVVQMFGKRVTPVAASETTNQFINPAQAETAQITFVPEVPAQAALQQELPATERSPVSAGIAGMVVKSPLINLGSFSKNLALFLSLLFMMTLVVDGIYIWRRRIVRVSGRTSAHLLFLFAITSLVWFISIGKIL